METNINKISSEKSYISLKDNKLNNDKNDKILKDNENNMDNLNNQVEESTRHILIKEEISNLDQGNCLQMNSENNSNNDLKINHIENNDNVLANTDLNNEHLNARDNSTSESDNFGECVNSDDNFINVVKTEMTDEEIMHHLDEIENIVLHSPSFIIQDDFEAEPSVNLSLDSQADEDVDQKPVLPILLKKLTDLINDDDDDNKNNKHLDENIKKNNISKENNTNKMKNENKNINSIQVKQKVDPEKPLKKLSLINFEDKLKTKENVVKDRLQRLSRVLEYSYPLYRKWLHKVEHNKGTAVCQLDKSVQSSTREKHTYRWKFTCQKIISDDDDLDKNKYSGNIMQKEKVEDSIMQTKLKRVSWKIRPTNGQYSDLQKDSLYPEFIVNIMKDFEEFLQNDPNVHKEATTNKEAKRDDRKEFSALTLRANYKNEVMVIVIGFNITTAMIESLKKYFKEFIESHSYIKSVYSKIFYTQLNEKNYSTTTFLCGSQTLQEKICNIRIALSPRTNSWCNTKGIELMSKVIHEYLPQWPNTTLLEIGCGIGLISLLMSHKFDEVIGMDVEEEIEEAKKNCNMNKIRNVKFMKDDPQSVETLFKKLKEYPRLVAIINNNAICGRSVDIIEKLRKLQSLKRLVVIVTFTKQSIRSIMELMHPSSDVLGNPFIPIRCCLVDTVPEGNHFELAMLMERKFMKRVIPDKDVEEICPPKKDSDYLRALNPMFNASEMDLRNQIMQKRNLADRVIQIRKSNSPIDNRSKYDYNNTEVNDVLENVKQQAILVKATKKLCYSSSKIDSKTERQVESMLNSIIEQTMQIQNKLPRIAKPQNEESGTSRMELPILLPGKSKKYNNIAPLEPNTFSAKRGRNNSGTNNDNRSSGPRNSVETHRRSAKERLNGFIENGSPPREINEIYDWNNSKDYEEKRVRQKNKRRISPVRFPNSPLRRYEEHHQNKSLRQSNSPPRYERYNDHHLQKSDSNQRDKYREYSPQRKNNLNDYQDHPPYQMQHDLSPQRNQLNYLESQTHYSRSRSPRQSDSPRRRYSKSRSPVRFRHYENSTEDRRISTSPSRRSRRDYSPDRKRKRYMSRSPSPQAYYNEEGHHNERNWRNNLERRDRRGDENLYDSYTNYESEFINKHSYRRLQDQNTNRYNDEISDNESHHENSSKDNSCVEVISVRSRSFSPHERWSSEKYELMSRSSRIASEKSPETSNSLRDPRNRSKNFNHRDIYNTDDLPDDAKDPWGEDNMMVINPIANINEDVPQNHLRYPNWTNQNIPINIPNQWQQSGIHSQQWMQMQNQSNIMPSTSWGHSVIQVPMMESNPNLGATPNIMHRSNVIPNNLMNGPIRSPDMIQQQPHCPIAGQTITCNGLQQGWNQNIGPQATVSNTRRNPNPHIWLNPNYKGYSSK